MKNFIKIKKQNKNLNPIISKSINYQRSDINILLNKVKLNEKLEKRKKTLVDNVKQFKGLLAEKDNMNDLKYFKNEIDLDNQKLLIDELKQINQSSTIDKPYRIILLEYNLLYHI